jgi:hypothetical protein
MDGKIMYECEEGGVDYLFWCEGCKCLHYIITKAKDYPSPIWQFNGDVYKPTISPSILVRGGNLGTCHFFVNNGMIQYLSDCTHELKNQTLPMWNINGYPVREHWASLYGAKIKKKLSPRQKLILYGNTNN